MSKIKKKGRFVTYDVCCFSCDRTVTIETESRNGFFVVPDYRCDNCYIKAVVRDISVRK